MKPHPAILPRFHQGPDGAIVLRLIFAPENGHAPKHLDFPVSSDTALMHAGDLIKMVSRARLLRKPQDWPEPEMTRF
jgi:hypothetical protein